MKHELKTDPDVFDDVFNGVKTFEIRKNDRNYQIGDRLILRRTQHTGEEMKNGKPLIYSGPECEVEIQYILCGPIHGLADGWVIMSIKFLCLIERIRNAKY